ncbi:histone deacetylase family protein [Azospirillum cavernae]|uniref:Histone deacetylase family protein n=1 Tax=Azospirillum cavernae TaxID=2320860 RepID=A0A418W4U9_9PROT|nr:histone deacetylase family protein [Azospirillum cavernae]RJF85026.1 histone deacetylase family protein [Azospirillum cavernae]
MIIIHSEEHRLQSGRSELNDGQLVPCYEKPERADIIRDRLAAIGVGPMVTPDPHGLEPLARVHDAGYLSFLQSAWDEWLVEHGDWDALPLNWVAPGMHRRVVPRSIDGRLGYYSFDAGTPITAGTWRAATAAANSALTGADRLRAGDRSAFALCRPPGHHAGRAYYGGYCFLNNAAIAAQSLRDNGAARVAVLDVDYHHGNGTQEIFWERGDVLFVSLHADPIDEFPYFSGHADETGAGAGAGATLNLPLPWGTDWAAYAEALAVAARRIGDFAPDALVVSLGADTYGGDPISRFRLLSEDFLRMGAALAAMNLPTLFVMEGGYAVADLGVNVGNVLTGFEGA